LKVSNVLYHSVMMPTLLGFVMAGRASTRARGARYVFPDYSVAKFFEITQ
jgi:hypothetical protein